jgi:hypothetical protein
MLARAEVGEQHEVRAGRAADDGRQDIGTALPRRRRWSDVAALRVHGGLSDAAEVGVAARWRRRRMPRRRGRGE